VVTFLQFFELLCPGPKYNRGEKHFMPQFSHKRGIKSHSGIFAIFLNFYALVLNTIEAENILCLCYNTPETYIFPKILFNPFFEIYMPQTPLN